MLKRKSMIALLLVLSFIAVSPLMALAGDQEPVEENFNLTIDTLTTDVVVEMPTEILATIDPNQEPGESFITAPFNVVNQTKAPIYMDLVRIQETSTMNLVLHDSLDWESLGLQDSRENIALGFSNNAGYLSNLHWFNLADNFSEEGFFLEATGQLNDSVELKLEGKHGFAFNQNEEFTFGATFLFGLAEESNLAEYEATLLP